jgi:DNA-binding transcriptional LysR family regulator
MIDLESVRLFILAVDLGSMTRAAEAAGTVQPVVSQRLKTLEQQLGRRLLDRTPRLLRLTEDGRAFLPKARELLAKHDEAVAFPDAPSVHFVLAASDHAIGTRLMPAIRAISAVLPAHATLEVHLGFSHDVRQRFLSGEADAAIIRRNGGGTDGEVLGIDPLGWRAPANWQPKDGGPIPLATLGEGCGVRSIATRELKQASREWRSAFVAGSCAALHDGVLAGIGIAPMGAIAANSLPDRGEDFGLPPLPTSEIVLLSRARSSDHAGAIRALVAAVTTALHQAR